MTLGIGYLGYDFALLFSDSMEFQLDGRTLPRGEMREDTATVLAASIDSPKIEWVAPRMAAVLSGNIPPKLPEANEAFISWTARQLREAMRPVNQAWLPDGRSFDVLVAGGPEGTRPRMAMCQRFGAPRVAQRGDVFIVGSLAPRARALGLERRYGELPEAMAIIVFLALIDTLIADLYTSQGCRNLADFQTRTNGIVPGIAWPIHLAVIRPSSVSTNTYQEPST